MVSLCSNCLKNNYLNDAISTPRISFGIEDPISKALSNLQAKIKLMDAQRKDTNLLLSTDLLSRNNNAESSFLYPLLKDLKNDTFSDLPKFTANEEDIQSKELKDTDLYMENELAHEALKLAEEKCINLENQLSAMKRLFLKRVVAKEDSTPFNYTESDCDSSNQLYEKSVEKLISNSDSGIIINTNESDNNKKAMKQKISGNIAKVDSPIKEKTKSHKVKFSKSPKLNSCHLNNYPFILGCSTTTSHNSAVKNQIDRRIKIQDQITRKGSASIEHNQTNDSALNNLRTVYFSLCDEYDNLFNEKMQMVDSLSDPKIKDLNRQKILDKITKSLRFKAEQIHNIKIMIKTFTTNYKNDFNFY